MKTANNVILIPKFGAKYTTIGFFIAAGSVYEEDKTGVAHLLEHVICTNQNAGVQLEAETQLEYMAFYSTQLSKYTATTLRKLHDQLFKDSLDQGSMAIQVERIELELETVFQHKTYQEVYGELFGKKSGQYRGWSGSLTDLKSVTFNDLLEYRKKHFKKKNTVLVIAGDFEQNEITDTIADLKLEHEIISEPPIILPIAQHQKMVWRTHMNESVADVDIFLPASKLSEFENRALDQIFSNCLIKGIDSLLGNLLYKELGSVYLIESELLHWTNGGVLAFGYSTLAGQAEETADKVHDLLSNLPEYLTKDVFEYGRNLSLLQIAMIQNDPERLVRHLGEDLLLTRYSVSDDERKTYLNNVIYEDILRRAEDVTKLPISVLKE